MDHSHFDDVIFTGNDTVVSSGTYSGTGIPVISVTCDANNDPYLSSAVLTARASGTVNEQAFDIITINTGDHTISMKRIGYGFDRVIQYNTIS